MNYVSESGLYVLIFGSTLPKAKKFKKWVTGEVLPNIRKNGFYIQDISNHSHNLESKFNELLGDLSKKSNEADEYKQKYYKNLELVNSLLLEKLRDVKTKQNTRLSNDEVLNIVNLYKQGLTQAQICRKVGRSDTAVRKAIRSVL